MYRTLWTESTLKFGCIFVFRGTRNQQHPETTKIRNTLSTATKRCLVIDVPFA